MSSRLLLVGTLKVTFICSIILVLSCVSPLQAAWVVDGVEICPTTEWYYIGASESPQIVADGAGGAFITWNELRDESWDIYVQRVDMDGSIHPGWPVDGVAVCTTENDDWYPKIISDDAGGAIIVWEDFGLNDREDIYAQRIDGNGSIHAGWPEDGVPVCTANSQKEHPRITPDRFGGVIVCWDDYRNGYDEPSEIYVQRIDPDGSVHAGWTVDGKLLCTEPHSRSGARCIVDDTGAILFLFEDCRDFIPDGEYGICHIYAQRWNGDGSVYAGWPVDGIRITTMSWGHDLQKIISDGAGGAFIVFTDYRNDTGTGGNSDLFCLRMDADGAIHAGWPTDGVAICTAASSQAFPQVVSDGAGGAIIAWRDSRSGVWRHYDIYAQRIDADGSIHSGWPSDGVTVTTAYGGYKYPQIVSDGAGGVIVTWRDCRIWEPYTEEWWDDEYIWFDIYAQRIVSEGTVHTEWPDSGLVICSAYLNKRDPRIASDGDDGSIITWVDERGVYAQRVNEGLAPVATLLQSFSARLSASSVVIEWSLSSVEPDAEFIVQRLESETGRYEDINSSFIVRDGLAFSLVDDTAVPGNSYKYRVTVVESEGSHILLETEMISVPALPLTLEQNCPNPFNPATTIRYYLPEKCSVRLEIFDVSGRRISTLINESQEQGSYALEWDGRDVNGTSVSSGTYFYRLQAGKEMISKKMVLLR